MSQYSFRNCRKGSPSPRKDGEGRAGVKKKQANKEVGRLSAGMQIRKRAHTRNKSRRRDHGRKPWVCSSFLCRVSFRAVSSVVAFLRCSTLPQVVSNKARDAGSFKVLIQRLVNRSLDRAGPVWPPATGNRRGETGASPASRLSDDPRSSRASTASSACSWPRLALAPWFFGPGASSPICTRFGGYSSRWAARPFCSSTRRSMATSRSAVLMACWGICGSGRPCSRYCPSAARSAADLSPGGVTCLFLGLVFLMPFARHETEDVWRTTVMWVLGKPRALSSAWSALSAAPYPSRSSWEANKLGPTECCLCCWGSRISGRSSASRNQQRPGLTA